MLSYTDFIHLLGVSLITSFNLLYSFVLCYTKGSIGSINSGRILSTNDLTIKVIIYVECVVSLVVSMIPDRSFPLEYRIFMIN